LRTEKRAEKASLVDYERAEKEEKQRRKTGQVKVYDEMT